MSVSATLLLIVAASVAATAPHGESVVLLHGLARDSGSMQKLADRLEVAGYSVTNVDYPSTKALPDELADILRNEVDRCCAESKRVHFVTYSMGGIVARAYLAETPPANLGRVVMIAPPNHGSEIVDLLGDLSLFRTLLGPTAVTLHTGADGLAQILPPPDYEVGVIAGDSPINPVGAAIIPGADDGTSASKAPSWRGWPISSPFTVRTPLSPEHRR